jgi:hypothetical protein
LRIEVLPASYDWEGGNTEHFARLRNQVAGGEAVKVIGLVAPAGQPLLRRKGRVSLSLSL